MTCPLVVGMGGSLRTPSTSLTALRVAVEGVADAGAYTRTLDLKRPRLPFYTSERAVPVSARRLADTVQAADALLWISPTYHGSVGGAFKNAVDWLALLADHDPSASARRTCHWRGAPTRASKSRGNWDIT
ncbi:NADPH-dependent FMN reductase [Streptomyces nigra]